MEPEWDTRSIARVLAHALRYAERELKEYFGANWCWCECDGTGMWQCTRVWAWRPTPRDGELSGQWSMCAFNVLVPCPDSAIVRAAIDATAAELEEYDVDIHRFFIPTGCPAVIDGGVLCTYFKKIAYNDDVCHVNVVAVLPPGRVYRDQNSED